MALEQLALLDDMAVTLARRARSIRDRWNKRDEKQIEDPEKIVGHQPGWANKETERSIDSDFTAGLSYDPKPGSPSYYAPYNALEQARARGIDVMHTGAIISTKNEKRRNKKIAAFENTSFAAYISKYKQHKDPFILVPESYEDEQMTWDKFAITSHEIGHGVMYGAVPTPLREPAMFFGSYKAAAAGGFIAAMGMSMGADPTLTSFSKKASRFGSRLAVVGSVGLLASETWANLYASRRLREVNAPKKAYEGIVGSEESYIGGSMLLASSAMIYSSIAEKKIGRGIVSLVGSAAGFYLGSKGTKKLTDSRKFYIEMTDKKRSKDMASTDKYQINATSSKMGTASSKAAKTLDNTLRTLRSNT
jgi:hypothetical protein